MAAIVFSNVGGAGSLAMRSISARLSAIPASSAGLKCSMRALSKGGTPPYGPLQVWRSGLSEGAGVAGVVGGGVSVSVVDMVVGSGAGAAGSAVSRVEEQPAVTAAARMRIRILRMYTSSFVDAGRKPIHEPCTCTGPEVHP